MIILIRSLRVLSNGKNQNNFKYSRFNFLDTILIKF